MSNASLVTVAQFDRAMIMDILRRSHSLLEVGFCEYAEHAHGYLIAVANLPFFGLGIAKEENEIVLIVKPEQYAEKILFWSMIQNEYSEFRRIDYTKDGVNCESGAADTISITLASDNRIELFKRIEKEYKECTAFESDFFG